MVETTRCQLLSIAKIELDLVLHCQPHFKMKISKMSMALSYCSKHPWYDRYIPRYIVSWDQLQYVKKKSYLFVCVLVDICSIARYVSPYITPIYRLFLLFIFSNYVLKLEIGLVSHSISFLCEEKFKFFCFYLNQLVFWIAAKMKLER